MASFDSYLEAREALERKCTAVEEAWRIATEVSEWEAATGISGVQQDSEVMNLVEQARLRLKSDTIEVGIFGEVKRGKSTLINALVGKRVSSMRVTPETAVPVWVENGPPRTLAVFNDGSSEEVLDTHVAQELATQRSEKKAKRKVARIIQYTELSWLPEGLRLVDTPGLQDPSLADSYEQRTMDELERVSAAIFMFVSPPGPAGHEVQLLRRLASHGIDKVFLVCNFYPDVWKDTDDRQSVLEYIKRVVLQSAVKSSKLAPKDIRLYAVNAKDGLDAIEARNAEAYLESGLESLRSDLEEYLTSGALQAVTAGATERIQMAKSVVLATLKTRERILLNPSALSKAVRDLEKTEQESLRRLEEIERDVEREGIDIGRTLGATLAAPYIDLIEAVSAASSRSEIRAVLSHVENLMSAAQSRGATEFDRRTTSAVTRFERDLLTSYGATGSFAGTFTSSSLRKIQTRPPVLGSVTRRLNWSEIMSTGTVSGLGSALVGGSLAGGAGIALLATGPVGLLIGAATMGVMGLLGGSIAGVARGVSAVSAADRKRIVSELMTGRAEAQEFGESQGIAWGTSIASALRSQRGRYVGEKSHELERIRRVLDDVGARERSLRDIESARALVESV